MAKLKLLLDVDEVICFSGYLEFVNEFLGTRYTIDDFKTYYIDGEAIPEERMEEFNQFVSDRNPYENKLPIPGAIEAITRLSELYDIYLCSDCINPFDVGNSGRVFKGKFDFLFRYIPQEVVPAKNYILTGTKNIFKADVQVDDLVKNFDSEIPGKFLFPSYHNGGLTDEELKAKGIVRAGYDWREGWVVLEKLLTDYAKEHKPSVLER